MDDTRAAQIRARWDKDALIDAVADAFNAHPMLLGYSESDRLLIAGALAIGAVKALPLEGLADLLDERERLLAVVEAAIAMEDVRTEPGHWSGQRTERQITTTAKFRAAVRAYRATTGEAGQ